MGVITIWISVLHFPGVDGGIRGQACSGTSPLRIITAGIELSIVHVAGGTDNEHVWNTVWETINMISPSPDMIKAGRNQLACVSWIDKSQFTHKVDEQLRRQPDRIVFWVWTYSHWTAADVRNRQKSLCHLRNHHLRLRRDHAQRYRGDGQGKHWTWCETDASAVGEYGTMRECRLGHAAAHLARPQRRSRHGLVPMIAQVSTRRLDVNPQSLTTEKNTLADLKRKLKHSDLAPTTLGAGRRKTEGTRHARRTHRGLHAGNDPAHDAPEAFWVFVFSSDDAEPAEVHHPPAETLLSL